MSFLSTVANFHFWADPHWRILFDIKNALSSERTPPLGDDSTNKLLSSWLLNNSAISAFSHNNLPPGRSYSGETLFCDWILLAFILKYLQQRIQGVCFYVEKCIGKSATTTFHVQPKKVGQPHFCADSMFLVATYRRCRWCTISRVAHSYFSLRVFHHPTPTLHWPRTDHRSIDFRRYSHLYPEKVCLRLSKTVDLPNLGRDALRRMPCDKRKSHLHAFCST